MSKVSEKALRLALTEIGKAIREQVQNPMEARIAALESKVATLEAQLLRGNGAAADEWQDTPRKAMQ